MACTHMARGLRRASQAPGPPAPWPPCPGTRRGRGRPRRPWPRPGRGAGWRRGPRHRPGPPGPRARAPRRPPGRCGSRPRPRVGDGGERLGDGAGEHAEALRELLVRVLRVGPEVLGPRRTRRPDTSVRPRSGGEQRLRLLARGGHHHAPDVGGAGQGDPPVGEAGTRARTDRRRAGYGAVNRSRRSRPPGPSGRWNRRRASRRRPCRRRRVRWSSRRNAPSCRRRRRRLRVPRRARADRTSHAPLVEGFRPRAVSRHERRPRRPETPGGLLTREQSDAVPSAMRADFHERGFRCRSKHARPVSSSAAPAWTWWARTCRSRGWTSGDG